MSIVIDRKYYKYTYTAFSQPVLSANGTIGGSSFAVTAVNTDSRTQPYYAFDSNKADTFTAGWLSKASNNYLEWYNPNPLNITKLVIQYQTSAASAVGYISSWKITASNDNTNYVDILSGTTSSYGVATISISHTGYYKYWRFYPLAWSSEWYDIIDLQITAQARTGYTESTISNYDFFRDIKIKDVGTHGVYYGLTPIKAIYYGSQLVYQYSSYNPETVLLNTATAGTYNVTLKKGKYYIALTGAGGRANGGYYYLCFQNSGGSGGTIAGNFYVNADTAITVVVGAGQSGKGQVSTLSVGGTQMMYADGGNYCHANGSCSGNTGGSSNSFNLSGNLSNLSLSAITGNNGAYSTSQAIGAYSNDPISNTRGQGATSSACNVIYGNAGGVYIKYIGYNK